MKKILLWPTRQECSLRGVKLKVIVNDGDDEKLINENNEYKKQE
jgi:hypothetical protein